MGILSKIKTNNSTFFSKTKCEEGHKWWVSFEFYPFAVGETSSVFEGRMYNEHGFWSQSKAAVKALNNVIGCELSFQQSIQRSEKARSLAESFKNEYPKFKKLHFVMPCIAEMDSVSVFNTPFRFIKGYEKQLAENECVLIEEFIDGEIQTFIDSRGVRLKTHELLDTFVHYSYVESNGQLVICKLEGVEKDNFVKITGPTIHSRNKTFGPRDQGEFGLLNVFKNHKCSKICKNWPTPEFGLTPTAPKFSEGQIETLKKSTKDVVMLGPPLYDQLIDKKPLVHGQIGVSRF